MIDFDTLFEEFNSLVHNPQEYNQLLVKVLTRNLGVEIVYDGGVPYARDDSRGKYLSIGRPLITAGYPGLKQESRYLKIEGVTTAGGAGLLLPRKATITALWAKSRCATSWVIEVRKNNIPLTVASVPVNAGFGSDMALDIDLNAGDSIELYLSGTGVDHPIAGLEIAWRAEI